MNTQITRTNQEPKSTFTVQENISLADKNWFGVGGPARFYCQPTTAQEFQEAVSFAQSRNLATFILGEGANILISDNGFNGLVIRPALQEITQEITQENTSLQDIFIRAEAGVSFEKLIDYCLNTQALGLEEFSGIPGTVGGSVFINIHFFEFLLSKFLVSGTVLEKATSKLIRVDHSWFNFSYNYSKLHEDKYYLVDAVFKLKKATELEAAYARGRSDEIKRYRQHRYPTARTCGSFFRNFHEQEVDEALKKTTQDKKILSVAYYLDSLGIKGKLACGGALVSTQHANMLVTKPHANSRDVVMLARTLQELLYAEYKLKAQPECQLIGFETYPLIF